eukprot:GSMAST32.ASY1.ANO1.1390.1 assembled CDS
MLMFLLQLQAILHWIVFRNSPTHKKDVKDLKPRSKSFFFNRRDSKLSGIHNFNGTSNMQDTNIHNFNGTSNMQDTNSSNIHNTQSKYLNNCVLNENCHVEGPEYSFLLNGSSSEFRVTKNPNSLLLNGSSSGYPLTSQCSHSNNNHVSVNHHSNNNDFPFNAHSNNNNVPFAFRPNIYSKKFRLTHNSRVSILDGNIGNNKEFSFEVSGIILRHQDTTMLPHTNRTVRRGISDAPRFSQSMDTTTNTIFFEQVVVQAYKANTYEEQMHWVSGLKSVIRMLKCDRIISLIHSGCNDQHFEEIKTLLGDIPPAMMSTYRRPSGETALTMACHSESVNAASLVGILLDSGCDAVDFDSQLNEELFSIVVGKSSKQIREKRRKSLSCGKDVTAFHYASTDRGVHSKILQCLLHNFFSINGWKQNDIKNLPGNVSIDKIDKIYRGLLSICETLTQTQKQCILEALCRSFGELHIPTALAIVVELINNDKISKPKLDPNRCGIDGMTPLTHTIFRQHAEGPTSNEVLHIFRAFLNIPLLDINTKDHLGNSALNAAITAQSIIRKRNNRCLEYGELIEVRGALGKWYRGTYEEERWNGIHRIRISAEMSVPVGEIRKSSTFSEQILDDMKSVSSNTKVSRQLSKSKLPIFSRNMRNEVLKNPRTDFESSVFLHQSVRKDSEYSYSNTKEYILPIQHTSIPNESTRFDLGFTSDSFHGNINQSMPSSTWSDDQSVQNHKKKTRPDDQSIHNHKKKTRSDDRSVHNHKKKTFRSLHRNSILELVTIPSVAAPMREDKFIENTKVGLRFLGEKYSLHEKRIKCDRAWTTAVAFLVVNGAYIDGERNSTSTPTASIPMNFSTESSLSFRSQKGPMCDVLNSILHVAVMERNVRAIKQVINMKVSKSSEFAKQFGETFDEKEGVKVDVNSYMDIIEKYSQNSCATEYGFTSLHWISRGFNNNEMNNRKYKSKSITDTKFCDRIGKENVDMCIAKLLIQNGANVNQRMKLPNSDFIRVTNVSSKKQDSSRNVFRKFNRFNNIEYRSSNTDDKNEDFVRKDWFLLKLQREYIAARYYDKTALHIALERGRSNIAQLLLSEGAKFDLTYNIIQMNVVPILSKTSNSENMKNCVLESSQILSDISEVRATITTSARPLHIACGMGLDSVVKLLLDKGAQQYEQLWGGSDDKCDIFQSFHKNTALHAAARNGHSQTVTLLIDAGAPLDTVTKYGRTALHLAAAMGHLEVTKLLVNAGAQTYVKDVYSCRPLDLAIRCGREFCVKILQSSTQTRLRMRGGSDFDDFQRDRQKLQKKALEEQETRCNNSSDVFLVDVSDPDVTVHKKKS